MAKKAKRSTKKAATKKAPRKPSWTSIPEPVRRTETLECACCTQFSVPANLVEEAKRGLREIYCPLGHEISWRDGILGRRQHTDKMLQREYEAQQRFADSIARSLLSAPEILKRRRAELKKEMFQELLDKV